MEIGTVCARLRAIPVICGILYGASVGPVFADVISSGDVCINTGSCPDAVIVADGFSSIIMPVTGSLTITPSSVISTGSLAVARGYPAPSPTGQLSITGSGAGINVSQDLSIGSAGLGTITVSNGGFLNHTGSFAGVGVGPNPNSNGILNVMGVGSRAFLSGTTSVGGEGSGSINVGDYGTLNAQSMIVGGALSPASTLNITTLGIVNTNSLSIGNPIGMGQSVANVSSSGILNANAVTISSTGTLSLAGGVVNASSINLISIPGFSSGSILGIGNLTGNINDSGGIIKPGLGASFGQLTLNGNLSFGGVAFPQSTVDLSVGGLSSASRDFLQVNGTANIADANIEVDFTDGFTPSAGQTIPLLAATGGITGTPTITFNQTPLLPYTFANGNLTFSAVPTCGQIINGGLSVPFLSGFEGGGQLNLTSITSTFTPNFGLTLSQAAAACGFKSFDWIQRWTNLPDPSPYYEVNPSGSPDLLTSANVPFSDPPLNGYTYCVPLTKKMGYGNGYPCLGYPFYWDPNAPQASPWSLLNYEDSNTLTFYDQPADACLPGGSVLDQVFECGGSAPLGSYLGFRTDLAGILPDGSPDDLGIGFSWTSTFNGTVGGISVTSNIFPVDQGSGTGGITIVDFNNTVPEPSAFSIFVAALGGMILSLNTMKWKNAEKR